MSKKIVPAALHALKQALTDVYWYKAAYGPIRTRRVL
jgi:hypothetical protein